MLENVIEIALKRGRLDGYDNYSFYRKLMALKEIQFDDTEKTDFVIS